jgi:hypothetical protein
VVAFSGFGVSLDVSGSSGTRGSNSQGLDVSIGVSISGSRGRGVRSRGIALGLGIMREGQNY